MDATVASAPQNLRPRRKPLSLLPREHGAYAQLGLPLVTALIVSPARGAAFAVALGAVAAFLAHEPLLVVTGGRGQRARRDHGVRALGVMLALGSAALTLGGVGLAFAPEAARMAAAPVLALAALSGWVALRDEERSTTGECLAAVTLSSAAVPVALAGGAGLAAALGLAGAWAVGSALNTLTVRGMIARGKSGGGSGLARAAAGVGVLVVAAALTALRAGALRAGVALAVLPPAAVAVALYLRPLSPRKLRPLGWTLIAAGVLSVTALVAG